MYLQQVQPRILVLFIRLKLKCGNPDYGQDIFSTGNYDAWLNSITDNLVLSALSNPGLMPVWELCETSARRQEVEEAFQQYASGFELPSIVTDAKPAITEILIRSGHRRT